MTFEDKLSWRSIETNIWSTEDLKKTRDELAPEPTIQSCDTGQWIPCFDSCQFTKLLMSIIKLHTSYRLP